MKTDFGDGAAIYNSSIDSLVLLIARCPFLDGLFLGGFFPGGFSIVSFLKGFFQGGFLSRMVFSWGKTL